MFHFTRQDSTLRWAAVIAGLSAVAACGGGGKDTPPPPAATRVVGVAATGAALAGASVSLIDADATTTDPAPQTADGDGRYSFGVDGLKAPFVLKVGYTQDGQARSLYAVLGSADANADNTANITPLSQAVAALVAPGGDPAALEAPEALLAATTGAKAGALADAVATLVAVLGSDPAIRAALEAAAGSGASFDPVRTPFVADGSGIDAVLEQLTVNINPPGAAAGTVQIQNNLQAVDGDAPAAPVRITPGTTSADAPTLPPTASGDLPTAADLDAFAAAFNACYALPATQRVTARDTSGAATAIAAACDFAVADYLNNGDTWIRNQGPSLLNANLDGATFQRPQVALVIPPVRVSDPKEDKHPYCDQTQCVVVDLRGTLAAAGGQPIRRTFLLAKSGAAWKAVGNQRPYDLDVQLRLNRLVNQNAAPLSPTSYFSSSRYEGMLRLALNPSGPGGINDVRAARVTGPGLPAAGVVLSRSSRCTSDSFAIVGKNGDTFVLDNGNRVPRYWTGNSSNDFKVGGATLDGADPTNWPGANVDYAETWDAADALKPWGVYTWEFFLFGSTTPAEPDRIHRHRLSVTDTRLDAFVEQPGDWWAELSAGNRADYLQPGGAHAGALTDAVLSWTVPAALGRVDSAYLFSQNTLPVNGVGTNKRTLLSPQIAQPGDTTASVTGGQTPWVAGTSTSTFTAGIAAAQNPRCSEADRSLTPLAGVSGDYREIGLSSSLTSGIRLQSVAYWSP